MNDKSLELLTSAILEGKDITSVLAEGTTILRDKGITGTDDVDELVLYISNDGDLYRSRTLNIINNLRKKFQSGSYDPELAIKAFMYLVDDGVRKYDKEFVSGQGKLFLDKATRTEIAKALRDRYSEEIMEESKAFANRTWNMKNPGKERFMDRVIDAVNKDFLVKDILEIVEDPNFVQVAFTTRQGDVFVNKYFKDGSFVSDFDAANDWRDFLKQEA